MISFVHWALLRGAEIRHLPEVGICPDNPANANPSIAFVGSDCYVTLRSVPYLLYDGKSSTTGKRFTKNFICKCKDPMSDELQFHQIEERKRARTWVCKGNEDIRLINWDGKLYESYTVRDNEFDGKGRIWLSELDLEQPWIEKNAVRFPGMDRDSSKCEKNWQPVEKKPGCFVVQNNPYSLWKMDIDNGALLDIASKKPSIDFKESPVRGSSQLVRIGSQWISIVHTSKKGAGTNTYKHAFVLYDSMGVPYRISDWFSFAGINIEFCCGLALHDSKFYISFALMDACSYILACPVSLVFDFIYGISKEPKEVIREGSSTLEINAYANFLHDTNQFASSYVWYLACGNKKGALASIKRIGGHPKLEKSLR